MEQAKFRRTPWGDNCWYLPSKGLYHFHRLDGPAIEYDAANGYKVWYVDGKQLYTKEVESWLEENEIDLSTNEGRMAFRLRFS